MGRFRLIWLSRKTTRSVTIISSSVLGITAAGHPAPGDKLGRIEFGSETGAYFREKIQAPFFARYLKDQGRPELPEVTTFRTGPERLDDA